MKKRFMFVLLLGAAVTGKAQISWFADGGLTNSRFSFNSRVMGGGSTTDLSSFYIRAGIGIKVNKKLCLENSLGFLSRKYRLSFFNGPDYGGEEYYTHESILLQSILSKNITKSKKILFYPGIGLYTALGLDGKMNYEYSTFGGVVKGTRKIKFGNESSDDFKRAELGILLQFHLEFHHIYLSSSYNFALTNGDAGAKGQAWKTFMAGIGCFFRKRK